MAKRNGEIASNRDHSFSRFRSTFVPAHEAQCTSCCSLLDFLETLGIESAGINYPDLAIEEDHVREMISRITDHIPHSDIRVQSLQIPDLLPEEPQLKILESMVVHHDSHQDKQ